jgi:SPP1 gp7 family putative phage head morphogenesis protein
MGHKDGVHFCDCCGLSLATDEVQPGSRELCHDCTMQAYGAQQWSSMLETQADFPYWMYAATKDRRTRLTHKALDGLVFRIDDPIAARFFPPWEEGCRCDAIPLMRENLEEEGLRVTDGREIPNILAKITGKPFPLPQMGPGARNPSQ